METEADATSKESDVLYTVMRRVEDRVIILHSYVDLNARVDTSRFNYILDRFTLQIGPREAAVMLFLLGGAFTLLGVALGLWLG